MNNDNAPIKRVNSSEKAALFAGANTETSKSDKKKAKLEAMRNKAAMAQSNAMVRQTEKLALLDSAKAAGWETTGQSGIVPVTMVDGGYKVSSRNITAEQKWPKWNFSRTASECDVAIRYSC